VGSARLASFVWPGMILAGLALATAVWAAWPEPTVRVVRLPYGESLPKAPSPPRAVPVTAPAAPQEPAPATDDPGPAPVAPDTAVPTIPGTEEDAGRVLAIVEPAPARVPAAPAPAAAPARGPTWGPAPVPSELDGLPGYEPQTPEELGAAPLPGFGPTPQAPRAAG
jgi:hypothetical protein